MNLQKGQRQHRSYTNGSGIKFRISGLRSRQRIVKEEDVVVADVVAPVDAQIVCISAVRSNSFCRVARSKFASGKEELVATERITFAEAVEAFRRR